MRGKVIKVESEVLSGAEGGKEIFTAPGGVGGGEIKEEIVNGGGEEGNAC